MRNWLYRGLVIIGAGLMAFSFTQMWWALSIKGVGKEGINAVQIFPYALKQTVPKEYQSFMTGSDMPAFFEPAMWTYLGIAILALLIGLVVLKRSGKLLRFRFNISSFIVGFVGISYALVIGTFLVVAAIRTGDFWGTHLLGETYVNVGGAYQTWVIAKLQMGFYLAIATSVLLLALGIFRSRIVGRQ